MHQRQIAPFRGAAKRLRALGPSLIVGLGFWIGFPTQAAYQDITSLVSGVESSPSRWGAVVTRSSVGSIHAAEMPFINAALTSGPLFGSALKTPGIGVVAFSGKGARSASPDEARVTRQGKRGRVLKMAPVLPPKAFNAGSVFQRTSLLVRQAPDRPAGARFATREQEGKEVAIASAFHPRADKKARLPIPAALAALVTNDVPDILATAYAPAAPDFARASPFDSLLNEPSEDDGRFIPPMGKGDHAWLKKPLPAGVFSKAEQKCLAEAIYFEARGESVQGQAAVAQVILNRVRAPAYPKTICGVVYQNEHRLNSCQFSFACDGKKDRISNPLNYRLASEVALAVTSGEIFNPDVGSSTHYHATYVQPGWANTMKKMKKIGLHVFYRTKRGGWS